MKSKAVDKRRSKMTGRDASALLLQAIRKLDKVTTAYAEGATFGDSLKFGDMYDVHAAICHIGQLRNKLEDRSGVENGKA